MIILKKLFKVFLFILLIVLLLGVVIFALRAYNRSKYKPADYNSDEVKPVTDLSNYDTNIEGVDVTRIKGKYINGFRLLPNEKTSRGVIVLFGGSEGSPNYEVAKILAKSGYETIPLFFFGMDNQQKELVDVPLEFFDEVLDYIDENVENKDVISLIGISKGAELSLNLAVRYPEIDNLVLLAPIDYSYQGLSFNSREAKSSWTWKGEEVPFISLYNRDNKDFGSIFNMMWSMTTNGPIEYRPLYESALKYANNKEEARIKVEDTKANILLIAGDDDKVWQADVASKNLYERRPENTEIHIYEGAGHLFFGSGTLYLPGIIMKSGGTEEANKKAGEESSITIVKALENWHK